jgi:DNA-binding NtrC family response regulator
MAPAAAHARGNGVSERAAGFAGQAMAVAAADHSATAAAAPGTSPGFHGAVSEFKRRLIETTLTDLGGNRTRTARALGLQRTYLLRLMREFEINVPAAVSHPRRSPPGQGAGLPQTR